MGRSVSTASTLKRASSHCIYPFSALLSFYQGCQPFGFPKFSKFCLIFKNKLFAHYFCFLNKNISVPSMLSKSMTRCISYHNLSENISVKKCLFKSFNEYGNPIITITKIINFRRNCSFSYFSQSYNTNYLSN